MILLEHAIEAVLDMKLRTADIKQEGDWCKLVGCVEMGQAVAEIVSTMIVKLMYGRGWEGRRGVAVQSW